MPHRSLVFDQSFDPEAVRCMSAVFDGVCADLGLNADHAREIVAKRVIKLGGGKRDPDQLRSAVLASLRGVSPVANARINAAIVRQSARTAPLHDNVVLAGLPPSDLTLLAPLLHVVTLDHAAGLHQELSLEHVYFPHQGMISLLGMTPDGETIEIASAGRHGALGPLLDIGVDEGILIAQGAQSISRVAVGRLHAVLRESETLRRALDTCREALLLEMRLNLVCGGLHPAERRLPRWLLEAADRMQTDVIPVTQQEVAQRLGVRRTTVSLVAGKIQESGAICWSRSRVSILDRGLLASAACSCYPALRRLMRAPHPAGTNVNK